MSIVSRLENEGGSKSHCNEQVAHSEAERKSKMVDVKHCLNETTLVDACNRRDGGEGGGGSHSPYTPSFLVSNKDNVNGQLRHAQGLITVWDFLEYKGRIGRTNVILKNKEEESVIKIMPVSIHNRYFEDGRLFISRKIKDRLGKYKNVPGLMETLTYDPKRISKKEAWASFGKDVRRFLNAINQYRKRRGWRRLHYLRVVEVQPDTSYPHVHIFFPNLKWLAPLSVINGNWKQGRANVEKPKKIVANCASYISKYLRKMYGWSDLHLALLWSGKCRMYGFSRGFSAKSEKKESEWQRLKVIETSNLEALEKSLEEGGYTIEK